MTVKAQVYTRYYFELRALFKAENDFPLQPLTVDKGSELEVSKRRYTGRVVFGGHSIHDEFGLAAEFPEQGSGASMISASKLCDAVAMLPGCDGEQSDATSAYTQSKLGTGMKGAYIVT